MPQPATHYLIARFSIPGKCYADWWDRFKPYFGLGSCAPDFFYFPLVPLVGKEIKSDLSWSDIANPLHSNNSYDMFCYLLDEAKKSKITTIDGNGGERAQKQFAFAFGYYTHVIADCIFHPYIYRATGDFWNTLDISAELLHKKYELYIDNELYRRYYPRKENIERMKIECNSPESELLDYDIAEMFNNALKDIYTDLFPNNLIYTDRNHPIQQAYAALKKTVPLLFKGKKIYLWGNGREFEFGIKDLVALFSENFTNELQGRTYGLNGHTPNELFKFAIIECHTVFEKSLQFWESQYSKSADFFALEENKASYIGSGNFNLDTGLPSEYNNFKPLRSTSAHEHYSFRKEILIDNYNCFTNNYNMHGAFILRDKQIDENN